MAATTRTVTDRIYKPDGSVWAGAVVVYEARSWPAIDTDGVIDDHPIVVTADENGEYSVDLTVPAAGTRRWRVARPYAPAAHPRIYYFNLGAGIPISWREIVAADVIVEDGDNIADLLAGYEPALGNPGSDGYILSSSVAGVRSWVAPSNGVQDVDDLATSTGSEGQLLRVAAAGGLEYRTPAEALTDIGGAAIDHDHAGIYEPAGTAAALVDDLSGVTDVSAARANLQLGSAAVVDASVFEQNLGNPASDGRLLSSTAAGVRSWVVAVGLAAANTWSALQTFAAGIVAAWIAPAADSTSAFQVRKADKSTPVLTVDTSNGELWVGATSSDTKIGVGAGRNKSGGNQTAYGADAGRDATGLNQTAIGRGAGRSNAGNYQTAIGQGAGQDNQGNNQSAFGYDAGKDNSGIAQIAFGQNAGKGNSGLSQTAVGYGAGENNTGDNTTFLGRERGVSNAVDGAIELGNALGALISGVCAAASMDSSIALNGVVTVAEDLIIPAPTVPASAAASGAAGQIAWDSGYLYVCVAAGSWKRVSLSAW